VSRGRSRSRSTRGRCAVGDKGRIVPVNLYGSQFEVSLDIILRIEDILEIALGGVGESAASRAEGVICSRPVTAKSNINDHVLRVQSLGKVASVAVGELGGRRSKSGSIKSITTYCTRYCRVLEEPNVDTSWSILSNPDSPTARIKGGVAVCRWIGYSASRGIGKRSIGVGVQLAVGRDDCTGHTGAGDLASGLCMQCHLVVGHLVDGFKDIDFSSLRPNAHTALCPQTPPDGAAEGHVGHIVDEDGVGLIEDMRTL